MNVWQWLLVVCIGWIAVAVAIVTLWVLVFNFGLWRQRRRIRRVRDESGDYLFKPGRKL